MHFEQTWRWYGPDDPVSLRDIKQTGATGIVTALHHLPAGELWSVKAINQRKSIIENAGLRWSVVESLPLHEAIHTRKGPVKDYLENYKQSIKNLAACGIYTICYNFMPILDWTRTELRAPVKDGSTALRYDHTALAAFDLHILKRSGAENSYEPSEIKAAKTFADQPNEQDKADLTEAIMAGLPEAEEHHALKQFKRALEEYRTIDEATYRSNLVTFLNAIIPVAEKEGVRMAIHPDDPPFPIFGLPRIVSTEADIQAILEAVDSPANGFTLCTGSLGAHPGNELPGVIKRLGHRIYFLHLRSVQRKGHRIFVESNHLEGDADMYSVMQALIKEQQRRKQVGRTDRIIPLRADHGHTMLDDVQKDTNPGYPCIGRLRGLAELRGLEMALRKNLKPSAT